MHFFFKNAAAAAASPKQSPRAGRSHAALRALALAALLLLATLFGSFTVSAAEDTATDIDASVSALLQLVQSGEEAAEEEHYNILFIGSDRRDSSWNGNSDAMILVSVNPSAKKIHLVSFMRDLYADIEGVGVRKLNSAYAVGGAELLESTLESNYGVSVDNYVAVGFNSLAGVIDSLGGVEITLEEAELQSVNSMASDMARAYGDPVPSEIYSAGKQLLSGYQAVAYSRIRKVGNNDYQRTARQRTVIEAMIARISRLDAEHIISFGTSLFTLVDHDLTAARILSLAAQAPEFLTYTIEESRVPFDGMYTSSNEILMPTQPETNEKIQEILEH